MTEKKYVAKKGYTKKNIAELFDSEDGLRAMACMLGGCTMASEMGFIGTDEAWKDYIYSVLVTVSLNYLLRAGKSGIYVASLSETIKDIYLNSDELIAFGDKAIKAVNEHNEKAREEEMEYVDIPSPDDVVSH